MKIITHKFSQCSLNEIKMISSCLSLRKKFKVEGLQIGWKYKYIHLFKLRSSYILFGER